MKILNFLKPKPAQPTIDSYRQASSGVEPEQMRSLMEWLFASLLNALYCGKSQAARIMTQANYQMILNLQENFPGGQVQQQKD